MLDVIFIVATILFFLLALAYMKFCGSLANEVKNK